MDQAETFEWLRQRSNRLDEVEAELWKDRLEIAGLKVKPIVDREKEGEHVKDLMEMRLDDRTKASNSMTTDLFTIKPLVWEWFEDAGMQGYTATGSISEAYVYRRRISGRWPASWKWVTRDAPDVVNECASPEEGKELAEAHWQAYMRQGLVPAAPPADNGRSGICAIHGNAVQLTDQGECSVCKRELSIRRAARAAAEEIREWIGMSGFVDGEALNEVTAIISRHLGVESGGRE